MRKFLVCTLLVFLILSASAAPWKTKTVKKRDTARTTTQAPTTQSTTEESGIDSFYYGQEEEDETTDETTDERRERSSADEDHKSKQTSPNAPETTSVASTSASSSTQEVSESTTAQPAVDVKPEVTSESAPNSPTGEPDHTESELYMIHRLLNYLMTWAEQMKPIIFNRFIPFFSAPQWEPQVPLTHHRVVIFGNHIPDQIPI